MSKSNVLSIIILLLSVSFVVLYHIFGYIGHFGIDDMEYAKIAYNLSHGITDYSNSFSFRWPIIFLTSISYKVFGVSDFASSMPAIIITVLILLLVFLTLKNKGLTCLAVGLFLITFSNWFIFYSDKLMPDIYVAFSIMLTLFILHKYKFENKKSHTVRYSFLFALSLIFGITAKETIILLVPLLIYFFIMDLIKQENIKFWIYSILLGIGLLIIYFLIIKLLTGDIFKRFQALSQGSYLNLCSYDKQSLKILLGRIIYEFFTMQIFNGMFTGYIFIIAFLIKNRSREHFLFRDSFSFYLVAAILLLLSSNFMTISVTSYIPMCLDVRHYLFLIPVVSVPASIILTHFIKDKRFIFQILAVILIITVLSYFVQRNTFWKLYLPLFILFGIFYFIPWNKLRRIIFIFLFTSVLIVLPCDWIGYAGKVCYSKQKEIVFKYIIKSNENAYIITNEVQKRLGNYYNGFDSKNNLKFISFNEFKFDTLKKEKKLLFLNWYTQYLSGMESNDLPHYAKYIDPSSKLIYENKQLNIALYEISEISQNTGSNELLTRTLNEFEKDIPHWNQNANDKSKTVSYKGDFSYKFTEYSSTFSFTMDSLPIKDFNYYDIVASVYCNFERKTSAKLVISLETNQGIYVWQNLDVNKYMKAYSNWWPVTFETKIHIKDLKKKSLLKVYVWNGDKTTSYIDNFEVKISGLRQ